MLTKKHFRMGTNIIRRIIVSGSRVFMVRNNVRMQIYTVTNSGALVVNLKPATQTTPGEYLAFNHKDFGSLRQFWHSVEIIAPFHKVMRDHLNQEGKARAQQYRLQNLKTTIEEVLDDAVA